MMDSRLPELKIADLPSQSLGGFFSYASKLKDQLRRGEELR